MEYRLVIAHFQVGAQEKGEGMVIKGKMEGFYSDGNILYFTSMSIS